MDPVTILPVDLHTEMTLEHFPCHPDNVWRVCATLTERTSSQQFCVETVCMAAVATPRYCHVRQGKQNQYVFVCLGGSSVDYVLSACVYLGKSALQMLPSLAALAASGGP